MSEPWLATLPPQMRAVLTKRGLSEAASLLCASHGDLHVALKVDAHLVSAALSAAAASVFPVPLVPSLRSPPPVSAFPVLSNARLANAASKLTAGCPRIDALLNGGIPARMLTELYGPAGAGKTQFALQLCVTCQWPKDCGGLEGGAAYILSEATFPSTRFFQLASGLHPPNTQSPHPPSYYSDNVHILHVRDAETQLHAIEYHLPVLIARHKLRLVVLDSIAATLRYGFSLDEGSMGAHERNDAVLRMARVLKRVASEFDCVILCLNQVSARVSNAAYGNLSQIIPLAGNGLERAFRVDGGSAASATEGEPALGLVWSHCVNTRLCMSKVESGFARGLEPGKPVRRRLRVVFSATGPASEEGDGLLCQISSKKGIEFVDSE